MADIVILSGVDRYTDIWHPFADTSAAIRDILMAAGHRVDLRETHAPTVLDPGAADLLVVNTGMGTDLTRPTPPDPQWDDAFAALGNWIDGGGPVLGTHTAANTFNDWPRWVEILGGRWTRGVSSHPEQSLAVFETVPGTESHPVNAGLDWVVAYDERYSFLELEPSAVPLRQHESGDLVHPCVWINGRAIYDSLGHDTRSYESRTRQELLRREVEHLLSL